jgi:hypothetical protein
MRVVGLLSPPVETGGFNIIDESENHFHFSINISYLYLDLTMVREVFIRDTPPKAAERVLLGA